MGPPGLAGEHTALPIPLAGLRGLPPGVGEERGRMVGYMEEWRGERWKKGGVERERVEVGGWERKSRPREGEGRWGLGRDCAVLKTALKSPGLGPWLI